MTVRFATFNVENLFARPRAFNQPTMEAGERILSRFRDFNALIAKPAYSDADKATMIQLLLDLEVYVRDATGDVRRNQTRHPKFVWLRANRGKFDVEREVGRIKIVAAGRSSWIGWLELATERQRASRSAANAARKNKERWQSHE